MDGAASGSEADSGAEQPPRKRGTARTRAAAARANRATRRTGQKQTGGSQAAEDQELTDADAAATAGGGGGVPAHSRRAAHRVDDSDSDAGVGAGEPAGADGPPRAAAKPSLSLMDQMMGAGPPQAAGAAATAARGSLAAAPVSQGFSLHLGSKDGGIGDTDLNGFGGSGCIGSSEVVRRGPVLSYKERLNALGLD